MADASSSFPALPPAPVEPRRNGRPAGPPVFFLALLIGAGLHLGVLLLFRFTVVPPRPAAALPRPPPIHFNDVANSPALRALVAEVQFSPEQIYLSTEKSFSSQTLPQANAPANPVSKPFPVPVASSEVDFHQPLLTTPATTGPGDALKPTQWDLLNSLGKAPTAGDKLAARGAIVRITRQDAPGPSTTPPIVLKWPASFAPPTGGASWQPVSFILRFNSAGLASDPVLDPGFDTMALGNAPNDPQVNDFLRNTLRDWFTQHPPLPPGQYEAVVGP